MSKPPSDNPQRDDRDLANLLGISTTTEDPNAGFAEIEEDSAVGETGSRAPSVSTCEAIKAVSTCETIEASEPSPAPAQQASPGGKIKSPLKSGSNGKDGAAGRTKPQQSLWMNCPERYFQVLESLRIIKYNLSSQRDKQNHNTFLMTGVTRGVGASTISFNLGLLLARDFLDQRILLIDANLSNPCLHKAFCVPLEGGLMDFLLSCSEGDHIVKASNLPNLDLVTLGTFCKQVTSPFDLARFNRFLGDMRGAYDFVILDSAPVLQSSHCRILSSKVDGVILVVEANASRWEVINEAKKQLENDGANLVGGILNKRQFVIPKWAYRFI